MIERTWSTITSSGTPYYMAPELLVNSKGGFSVEIWS
jgi:serine/threonine protein kinase